MSVASTSFVRVADLTECQQMCDVKGPSCTGVEFFPARGGKRNCQLQGHAIASSAGGSLAVEACYVKQAGAAAPAGAADPAPTTTTAEPTSRPVAGATTQPAWENHFAAFAAQKLSNGES